MLARARRLGRRDALRARRSPAARRRSARDCGGDPRRARWPTSSPSTATTRRWRRSTTEQLLDGWIFAADDRVVREVWSAGRHVVQGGRHVARDAVEARYRRTMAALIDRA